MPDAVCNLALITNMLLAESARRSACLTSMLMQNTLPLYCCDCGLQLYTASHCTTQQIHHIARYCSADIMMPLCDMYAARATWHGISVQAGEEFVLTIRNPAVIKGKKALGVSYEAFVDDVQVTHMQLTQCWRNIWPL